MVATTHLASNLRALRLKARLTQDAVASVCNVDRATVSKWETGEIKPRVERLVVLARLYKCSINRFFKEQSNETHSAI